MSGFVKYPWLNVSGLRKVADDEKTHKNPALRAGSLVPQKSKAPAPSAK
jgi:hypothetical protein